MKNKIQYGGFRFRDIITQENLDKHIGKEVEIISLWGEHAKNELDKLTANTVGPGNHDMAHTWRYLTEEGRRYRYIDLINFREVMRCLFLAPAVIIGIMLGRHSIIKNYVNKNLKKLILIICFISALIVLGQALI